LHGFWRGVNGFQAFRGPETSVGGKNMMDIEPVADVHNRTDDCGRIWDDRGNHAAIARRIKTMLFTVAVLVAAGGAVMFYQVRAGRRVNSADLGWMSAQWLAEHRASNPP
jgi:hypothetical protein